MEQFNKNSIKFVVGFVGVISITLVVMTFIFKKVDFSVFNAAALGSPSSMQAWVLSSLERTTPTALPGDKNEVALSGGKGEYVSFQVAIKSPSGGLSNVNVNITNLVGSAGMISSSYVTLYRENFAYVSQSSPNWGGSNQPISTTQWFPEGLIPFKNPDTGADLTGTLDAVPFNLAAGQNAVIWADVQIPRDATPGLYAGNLNIINSQGSLSVPVNLQVWNFSLPSKPTEKSAFLMWSTGGLNNEKEILRQRLMPQAISNPADEPDLVVNFGLNTTGLPFWSGADIGNCSMSAAPSISQIQQEANKHPNGLPLYDYSADEIWGDCLTQLIPKIKEWARNLHAVAGVDNLMVTTPHSELYDDGSGTGRSAVDIWVVLPKQYNKSDTDFLVNKGDEVWSYNALVQDAYSPKWTLDFPLINERIQAGFLNANLGITGLLYWRTDLWNIGITSYDPWDSPNNTGKFASANYPSDGLLTYPGDRVGLPGRALAGMRMKSLRDGIQDYEYVELLKKAGWGAWAHSQIDTIASSWSSWTQSASQLESVRNILGQKLNELGGGVPPLPVDVTPPNTPTGLTATAISASQINLSWNASTDNVGVTGYKIFRGNIQIATTTNTSYQNTGLNSSTSYSYSVAAFDLAGNISAQSSQASATTQLPPDITPPLISSLQAKNITQTSATISWTTNEPATTQIEYGPTTLFGFVTIFDQTLSISHSQTIANLNPDTIYYYRVYSWDQSQNLKFADGTFTTLKTTPSADITPPSKITRLNTTSPTYNSINLKWIAPGDDGNIGTAAAYDIRYSTVPISDSNWVSCIQVGDEPIPALSGTQQTYEVNNLKVNTKYYFAIKTMDESGNLSVLSKVANATTKKANKTFFDNFWPF